MDILHFIKKNFGVDPRLFLYAIKLSPSAQGYILGAISELVLMQYLESRSFEVLRIKEKPSGGNLAKNVEARGDFYIRKKGDKKDEWLVIESKGLKSNSEFRGSKLDNKSKLYNFLKSRAFVAPDNNERVYNKGYSSYLNAKRNWESKHPGKNFPPFKWDKSSPGPEACDLRKIWKNEADLKQWVESQPDKTFLESAYRNVNGPIAILETHQPSTRTAPITGKDQAAPLVTDFNIMAVDLFLRTGKHEFVFMNAETISHSPTSPEHLYQNYIIDILAKERKVHLKITHPWYSDIQECIDKTKPRPRPLDETQLDTRS